MRSAASTARVSALAASPFSSIEVLLLRGDLRGWSGFGPAGSDRGGLVRDRAARLEDDLGLPLPRLDLARLDLLRPVALDEMAFERPQDGLLVLAARRLDEGAAGVEAAGVRRVRRAGEVALEQDRLCLLYTSPSPRDS